MEIFNERIDGIMTALQPISHNRWGVEQSTDESGFRTIKMAMPVADGDSDKEVKYETKDVFTISGNAARGLGRTLFFEHNFQQVLNVDWNEIFSEICDEVKRPEKIRFFHLLFAKGGINPASLKAKPARAGAYNDAITALPMLDLLGGTYGAHFVESSLKMGFLIPVTKETQRLMRKDGFDAMPEEDLISLEELKKSESKEHYLVKMPADDQAENGSTDQHVFWVYSLPAGTRFYFSAQCISPRKPTILAFRAFVALLANYGYMGGMSRMGYGRVIYDIPNLDRNAAIQEWDNYLIENREAIIEAMKALAADFDTDFDAEKSKQMVQERKKKTSSRVSKKG